MNSCLLFVFKDTILVFIGLDHIFCERYDSAVGDWVQMDKYGKG